MLNQIKTTMNDPKFQRDAAQAAGKVVSIVASMVISSLVSKAVEAGVSALMDKIQATEVPAE